MGFDPPLLGEVHEVIIQLEGPVGDVAFDDFQKELKKCIKTTLHNIQDGAYGNQKLNVKATKKETKPKP